LQFGFAGVLLTTRYQLQYANYYLPQNIAHHSTL